MASKIVTISYQVYECVCDVCRYHWRTDKLALPVRCANTKCRSRRWNGTKPVGRPRKACGALSMTADDEAIFNALCQH